MKKKLLLLFVCCIIAQQVNGMVHFKPRNTTSLNNDQLNSQLFKAVINSNAGGVKFWVQHGADVNAKDENSHYTPLLFTIIFRNQEIAEILIKNGTNINARNYDGLTPLHLASCTNNSDIIKILLKSFIRQETNIYSRIAARSFTGKSLISPYEINEFINAKTGHGGDTSLHLTVLNNSLDAMKALIFYGAEMNISNHYSGDTPLHQAAASGRLDMVEILLKNGANKYLTNIAGQTPYNLATTDEIKSLLQQRS